MTAVRAFTGDRHAPMNSPLAAVERRLIDAVVPMVPRWLEGYHLTLMTVLWSAGILAAGFAVRVGGNQHWLWLSSLMLVCQWATDSLDGSLGRYRDTGIPLWGYYMDHFLDYVFMACVFGHYAFFSTPPTAVWVLVLVPLYGAFEANSWLEFGATGEFRITYAGIGPTEIRLAFVALNTCLIWSGPAWLEPTVPWVFLAGMLLLAVVVWGTQKRIWALDMAAKQGTQAAAEADEETPKAG